MDLVRPWASVTKVAVAYGAALELAAGRALLVSPAGPHGSTLAHLLAHASGLGLEDGDPTMPAGARRIYSNCGIDLAADILAGGVGARQWIDEQVCNSLGLAHTSLQGRASSGAYGPVRDLATLGAALATNVAIAPVRDQILTPFLPELAGVVPGFGRFEPCWWGLGIELHGHKRHWMGSIASERAAGHFGQSGALLMLDPTRSLVVVAAAGEPFGPWARELWPRWMDEVVAWSEAT